MPSPTRRVLSSIAGLSLLSGIAVEGYFQSWGVYEDHFLIPNAKYGSSLPLRWQDVLFIALFWCLAVPGSYLACRLLKHALR